MKLRLLALICPVAFFFLAFSSENQETPAKGVIQGIVQLPQIQAPSSPQRGRYRRGGSQNTGTAANQNVLIWIEADRSLNLAADEPELLDQTSLQFNPRILAVRRDQSVRILNSDPIYHNVFSLSSVKRFDVGRRPKGEYLDVTFDKQGKVDVFCDIHSNMHAIIYVVSPRTYSWITHKAGNPFNFDFVPDGDYKLNIYAPGFEKHSRDITVENGNTVNLGTITLHS